MSHMVNSVRKQSDTFEEGLPLLLSLHGSTLQTHPHLVSFVIPNLVKQTEGEPS